MLLRLVRCNCRCMEQAADRQRLARIAEIIKGVDARLILGAKPSTTLCEMHEDEMEEISRLAKGE